MPAPWPQWPRARRGAEGGRGPEGGDLTAAPGRGGRAGAESGDEQRLFTRAEPSLRTQASPAGDELDPPSACILLSAGDWVPSFLLAFVEKSLRSCLFVTQSCSFTSLFWGVASVRGCYCSSPRTPGWVCVLAAFPWQPQPPSDGSLRRAPFLQLELGARVFSFSASFSFQRLTGFSKCADPTAFPISNDVRNDGFSGNGVGTWKAVCYYLETKALSIIFKISDLRKARLEKCIILRRLSESLRLAVFIPLKYGAPFPLSINE